VVHLFLFSNPQWLKFFGWIETNQIAMIENTTVFSMSQEPKPKDEEQDPAVPFTQMSTSAGERMDLWSKRYQST